MDQPSSSVTLFLTLLVFISGAYFLSENPSDNLANQSFLNQSTEPEVNLLSDFQLKLGCTIDFDPTCPLTKFDKVGNHWQLNLQVPAGSWHLKIMENGKIYGQNGLENGPDISLTLKKDQNVVFFYEPLSHKLNIGQVSLENRSLPVPLVTLTLEDTLIYDPGSDMIANPGDSIRYTMILKNQSGSSMLNAVLTQTGDPNTTYDPNSLKASPLAFNDTFPYDAHPKSLTAAFGLLANDYDLNDPLPNPPFNSNLTVVRVNGLAPGGTVTTLGGGSVSVMPDGAFVYDSTGTHGATADVFQYTILDQDGFLDSAMVQIRFNAPPLIASGLLATDSICAFEQQDTFVMTSAFSIMDDGTSISSAKIQICNNYMPSEDTLLVAGLSMGITASWVDVSGTLMLMGTASLANYETAIENIQYINQSDNPNTSSRTICITVNDGTTNSNPLTRELKVKPVNDCPTAIRDTFYVNENASFPVSNVLTNDLDAENNTLIATVISNVPVNGGIVNLLANGSFDFAPTTGATGLDTLNEGQMFFARAEYAMTDGICMDQDSVIIKVTGVNDAPLADSNSYASTQTTILSVSAPGILADDKDIDHASVVMVGTVNGSAGNVGAMLTLASGASLTVNANGSFSYSANCVAGGVDSFSYQAVDEHMALSNIVKVYITISQSVWYVSELAAMGGNGSFGSPFQSLSSAESASAAGDCIFVFPGTYPQNLTLKNNQKLIGADEDWLCSATVIRAKSGLTYFTGTLTVASGNTIKGIEFGAPPAGLVSGNFRSASSVFIKDNGSTTGNLLIANCDGIINGGTKCLMTILNGGTLNVTFDSVAISSQVGVLDLRSCAGNITLAKGGISTLSTGDTTVSIIGGTLSATINTTILQSSNFPLLFAGGGHSTGTVLFQTGMLTMSSGSGLQFDDADGNYIFNGVTTMNGGDAGIDILNGSSGTFNFSSNTSISRANNVSGAAFNLNSSDANVTYSGSMTLGTITGNMVAINNHEIGTITFSTGNLTKGSSTTQGINIQNSNSGTINFNNPTISITMTSGNAVSLTSNMGGTMNFTPVGGGNGIDLITTSGIGFNATGGGTVNVTGTGNTISSTTGTALNINATTIGASNLTFQSISAGTAASGPTNGIVLNTTGTSGGLVVTGTGSAGSGGTIRKSVTGISLTSTINTSLSWVQLNDFTDFAIRGDQLSGFNLLNSVINGVNGDVVNEGSIQLTGLTGTAAITGCNISGGVDDNIRIVNTSGSLNRIVISNTTIGANSNALGNDGLFIEAQSTASIKATVQNCIFTSARGDLFQFSQLSSGSSDIIFSSNVCSDNHPSIVSGGGGVTFGGIRGTFTFTVSDNTFRDATGTALAVSTGGFAMGDYASSSGTISGNQIGLVGVSNSGSTSASGIALVSSGGGSTIANINGNTIRQYNNHGILLQCGQVLGNPTTFEVTVSGNSINTPGNLNTDFNGIHLNNGTVPGENFTSCVNILNNSVSGAGQGVTSPNNNDIRLRQRQSTTVKLTSYGGANNDDAAVATYLIGRQTTIGTAAAANTVGSGGGGFIGGTCNLPALISISPDK